MENHSQTENIALFIISVSFTFVGKDLWSNITWGSYVYVYIFFFTNELSQSEINYFNLTWLMFGSY